MLASFLVANFVCIFLTTLISGGSVSMSNKVTASDYYIAFNQQWRPEVCYQSTNKKIV